MVRVITAVIATFFVAAAGDVFAQPAGSDIIPSRAGTIDFGVRMTSATGNPTRNERYRDLREGPVIDTFRYNSDRRGWLFASGADHVGYRDQRYFADLVRPGKVQMNFEWNQIPLNASTVTATLYTNPSAGVFRIADSIQQGLEAGTLRLADVAPGATQFDLRSRRETATFNLIVTPAKNLDLKVNLRNTRKIGEQQWGIGFGFSNQFEVPAPLDHRTTDLGTAAEWSNTQAMVRVGYDGSWFDNHVESLVADDPLRLTDAVGATSQGRMALWPSSHSNAVNTAGTLKLPAHSQATAYISVGEWVQNEPLIPFTINPAITPIPLDRPTAEADALVTAMNYTASSHPTNELAFTARFKRYDFDNRTPHFAVVNYVRTDQTVAASASGGSEALGYIRDNVDADVSYTPRQLRFTAFRLGYALEDVERTHRFVETTRENSVRASVDVAGNAYVSVRTAYEHSERTGSGLDEEVLDDAGEQTSLRQFDISDRSRNRVSTTFQVMPRSTFGFNGTISTGSDHRPDASFGVQHLDTRAYAVGADYIPAEGMSVGLTYGYENYKTRQRSRQASPGVQFNDPTRDWSTLGFDHVNTASIAADFLKAIPRTELRFGYDFSRSTARYDYILTPDTTLPPVAQLPSILNDLRHGTLDARYRLRGGLTLGLLYWYDRYRVEDFALDSSAIGRIDINTGSLLLRNPYLPYTEHTVTLRMAYFW